LTIKEGRPKVRTPLRQELFDSELPLDPRVPVARMDEALTSEYPLEAHLFWHTFVQTRAEAQPIFRRFRNHYTRPGHLCLTRRRAGGHDLLRTARVRGTDRRASPCDAGPDVGVHPGCGSAFFSDPDRGYAPSVWR
jgi:hypothetical protein